MRRNVLGIQLTNGLLSWDAALDGTYETESGYLLSPISVTALVWRSQFAAIFLASAAVGGLAFVLTLRLPEPHGRGESAFDDDDFALSGLTTALRQTALWPWYAVLAGTGVGTVWANTDALVSTLAQRGQMGATMSVASSFTEFGDLLGPLLIGLLVQRRADDRVCGL